MVFKGQVQLVSNACRLDANRVSSVSSTFFAKKILALKQSRNQHSFPATAAVERLLFGFDLLIYSLDSFL